MTESRRDRAKRGEYPSQASHAMPGARRALPSSPGSKPTPPAPLSPTSVSPLTKRYVIYSPEKGIFLGDTHWSKGDHGGKTEAPCFTKEECDALSGLPADARRVEVYPDIRGKANASMDALLNACLPGWNPAEAPHDVGEDQTH